MGDEISAKQDEFSSLISLGQKMYARRPGQETEEQVLYCTFVMQSYCTEVFFTCTVCKLMDNRTRDRNVLCTVMYCRSTDWARIEKPFIGSGREGRLPEAGPVPAALQQGGRRGIVMYCVVTLPV